MQKTILITGSTDGIGYLTAKSLVELGHNVIIHGRNLDKLEKVKVQLEAFKTRGTIHSVLGDLSVLKNVEILANDILSKYTNLDVLINNAGIFKTNDTRTVDGFDIRFSVNTLAPYLLMKKLRSILGCNSRVVNLSSAAQAEVALDALRGKVNLGDVEAYAQSKLAITMWTSHMAKVFENNGPLVVSVNPKSLLASKMVKEAYGIAGSDLSIGSDILVRASLSDEFKDASGKYYDNDIASFSNPHPAALNEQKCEELVSIIEGIISD